MTKIVKHPNVELRPTSSLKPSPRNAKRHDQRQISLIADSIKRFGWLVPIIIDVFDMIVAGHGRWLAAKSLGLTEVPVIRAEFLTDADRRAFALAENRIAELSSWDENILGEEMNFLFEGGNLDITGFTTANLDFSLPDAKGDAKPERVELPAANAKAVSRVGDKWVIGMNAIYNGDARKAESYEAVLGEERATIVFADPPYNCPIDGFVAGKGRHREFVMAVGEMSQAEFTAFLRAIYRNCVRFSVDGSIHYQCMDWRHLREVLDAADGVYTQHKQLIVWDKQSGSLGTFYRSQHELVFVFKNGRSRHINNFGLGDTGRYRTNVVKYPGASGFRKGRKRDSEDHSTIKSTALIADFLLDCSNRGDLVLDPTVGSRSTLLAAAKTGRRGAGIELDPLYVDVALKRLSDATGLTPTLAGDGRTFDEIREARSLGEEE